MKDKAVRAEVLVEDKANINLRNKEVVAKIEERTAKITR